MKTEPAEAMRERIKELFEITAEDVAAIEANAMRNEIIALAAFKKGQSYPKIKQLEWDFYGAYYSSKTPIGEYTIEEDEGYLLKNDPCKLLYNGSYLKTCTSVDEVKAAAQADFERRVMECIISE